MVAIIPARGGSKGLPRKNILDFCGKPLIQHTIAAAAGAQCISRVIVTTDDKEIAQIASDGGAEVPFLRPASLAADDSKAVDVYNHALRELEHGGARLDQFCVLLPTSPLRQSSHIDEAYQLFMTHSADSVISVSSYEHSIFWALESDEKLRLTPLFPEGLYNNRQNLQKVFRPNGAIYIFKRAFWDTGRGYYGENSFGYPMASESSIDIDTRDDFEIAEFYYRKNTSGKV